MGKYFNMFASSISVCFQMKLLSFFAFYGYRNVFWEEECNSEAFVICQLNKILISFSNFCSGFFLWSRPWTHLCPYSIIASLKLYNLIRNLPSDRELRRLPWGSGGEELFKVEKSICAVRQPKAQ